ncbi:hypothetical protein AN216_15170 [Streptomyces oceani]|uniref:G domain-containing protein n=1 Tax=Streptomyces oceani TaxID=1075402 RepID=A0A1E7KG68_9ACTN|nr:hypothetical protein AN216_15170 [Streptomyces oceani]
MVRAEPVAERDVVKGGGSGRGAERDKGALCDTGGVGDADDAADTRAVGADGPESVTAKRSRRAGEPPAGAEERAAAEPAHTPVVPEDRESAAHASRGDTTSMASASHDECGTGERSLPATRAAQSPSGSAAGNDVGHAAEGETLGTGGLGDHALLRRLGALRELIGLSRTRVDGQVLTEAGRVLDEATARGRLSGDYTTVAIAGATGSGKSSLFNALAGRALSEVGTRRPTTARPVGCTWEAEREGGADGLLDRLGVAPVERRRVRDAELHGLVLIDLPDHDSMAEGHREQVDRLLGLVDAVVWVVDPEKYADAVLHERYLRPLAGYAEVTFVVLNQTDRLPGEATDAVLDDLRRLLDEDGMALGEHGEPGAGVLATSALTGEGVGELRAELAAFVAAGAAPARRLAADLDGAAERLRPAYADPHLTERSGLTDTVREDFEDRLASAVGATAAGQAAERAWLRHAERSCGTPWAQLVRWRDMRRPNHAQRLLPLWHGGHTAALLSPVSRPAAAGGPTAVTEPVTEGRSDWQSMARSAQPLVARPVLAQAVRELAARAVTGLPDAWRKTVRDAAWRGAEGLPEALDAVVSEAAQPGADDRRRPVRMQRPPWWTAATAGQGLLLALQVLGVVWLVGAAFGAYDEPMWLPVLLVLGGACSGPLLAWGCRAAARGPARGYGQEEERRLRRLAVSCGRSRVLEPVAAELLRYHEVREQYVVAAGDTEPS